MSKYIRGLRSANLIMQEWLWDRDNYNRTIAHLIMQE